MKIYQLKEASDKDAFLLTSIAKAAKASWGYSNELLSVWNDDLTISTEMINICKTYVLEHNSEIIGFCMMNMEDSPVLIEHLWLLPNFHRRGLGKRLLAHAIESHADDFSTFVVISDPHAQAFYENFGFVKTHEIEGQPKGRILPYLVYKC
jgi:ribosomal protein S18 acetylase RimI-like enzyme